MKKKLGLAIFLLLLATGIRAWHLDMQSIWFDEGFSWHAATQPTLVSTVNGDPTNPPLYYLMLHGWVRLMGDSEFGLRSLSLLLGIVLLACMTSLAHRWFNTTGALLALGIGTFTPLLWWASQEARMYNLLALTVLCMASGLIPILHNKSVHRHSWILLITGELGALYTHNTGIVVLGAVNLVFAASWMLHSTRPPRNWQRLFQWAGSQALVVALWLPELMARFSDLGAANAALRTTPELSLGLLHESWQAIWASSWEMVLVNPPQLQIASLLLLTLLMAGLFSLRQVEGRAVWGLILSLYGIMLAALTVLGVNLHGRYLVMLAPLLIIAVSGGLAQIPLPLGIRRMIQVASVLAVGITWFALPGRPEIRYQHDQAREMVAYYADTLTPNDVVLTWSYAKRYELQYYAERTGLAPELITLPEGADRDVIAPLLDAALGSTYPTRAEINTWYTQASDRRGMLPCLVGHNNMPPLDSFTVQGMTTTGYQIEQPISAPAISEITANLGEATLTGIGMPEADISAGRGICIPVQVTVQTPHDTPLGAAINMQNDLGWELAGADAPLLTASQVPSDNLDAGATVTAYPIMYPPDGLPTGVYPVQIRIYNETHPDGLDVLSPASNAPTGKNTDAGSLQITHDPTTRFDDDCALAITQDLTLTNCDDFAETTTATAGETLRLTFAWQTSTAPLPIEVTIAGEDWQVSSPSVLDEQDAVLDWHMLTIPPDAEGRATLTIHTSGSDPVEIATYTIEASDRLLTPPPVAITSGIRLPGAGTVYGVASDVTQIQAGEPLEIEIVWLAEAATATPFNATVQLLSSEGILLAQHDGEPASGERPTTGWRDGEYIVDQHELQFREEMAEYVGEATLIAALYNPQDGTRLLTESGADHVTLTSTMVINGPD